MQSATYTRCVRVVSALLYQIDPSGMGSSVFAPRDEYDDAARLLTNEALSSEDLELVVRDHYPSLAEPSVDVLVDVLSLCEAAMSGAAPSD